MLGTIVNTVAVILGGLIGLIAKKGLPERLSDAVFKALGLCTLYIGISGSLKGENTLILILSMVLGVLLGEALDLDKRINRLCEMVEDLPEDIQDELSELLGYYSSLEDLCEHADDIIHYPDCDDMTDVAYYFIDECQSLGEIPDRIRSYIDYEAYGRDLDLEGRFVVTNHGVFECPY